MTGVLDTGSLLSPDTLHAFTSTLCALVVWHFRLSFFFVHDTRSHGYCHFLDHTCPVDLAILFVDIALVAIFWMISLLCCCLFISAGTHCNS